MSDKYTRYVTPVGAYISAYDYDAMIEAQQVQCRPIPPPPPDIRSFFEPPVPDLEVINDDRKQ